MRPAMPAGAYYEHDPYGQQHQPPMQPLQPLHGEQLEEGVTAMSEEERARYLQQQPPPHGPQTQYPPPPPPPPPAMQMMHGACPQPPPFLSNPPLPPHPQAHAPSHFAPPPAAGDMKGYPLVPVPQYNPPSQPPLPYHPPQSQPPCASNMPQHLAPPPPQQVWAPPPQSQPVPQPPVPPPPAPAAAQPQAPAPQLQLQAQQFAQLQSQALAQAQAQLQSQQLETALAKAKLATALGKASQAEKQTEKEKEKVKEDARGAQQPSIRIPLPSKGTEVKEKRTRGGKKHKKSAKSSVSNSSTTLSASTADVASPVSAILLSSPSPPAAPLAARQPSPTDHVTMALNVPPSDYGVLYGRDATNIRRLRERCQGVVISIPKMDAARAGGRVLLQGSHEACVRAKGEFEAVLCSKIAGTMLTDFGGVPMRGTPSASERSQSLASPSHDPSISIDADGDTDYSLLSSASSSLFAASQQSFLASALSPLHLAANAPCGDAAAPSAAAELEVMETMCLLRDGGIITPEEFKMGKHKLVGKILRRISNMRSPSSKPPHSRPTLPLPPASGKRSLKLSPCNGADSAPSSERSVGPTEASSWASLGPFQPCEERGRLTVVKDVPEYQHTAGSIQPGASPADACLHSATGWEPDFAVANGNWHCMDLGEAEEVYGVALRHAAGGEDAYVTSFRVLTSADGVSWQTVDDGAGGAFEGCCSEQPTRKVLFPTPVTARWVKLYPVTWVGRAAMRCGVVVEAEMMPPPSPPPLPVQPSYHYDTSISTESDAEKIREGKGSPPSPADPVFQKLMKYFAAHHPEKIDRVDALWEHRELLRVDSTALQRRLEAVLPSGAAPRRPHAARKGCDPPGGAKTTILIINKTTNKTVKLRACVASLTADRLKWFVAEQWGLLHEDIVLSSRSGIDIDNDLRIFQDEIRTQRVVFCDVNKLGHSDSDSAVSI
eukprot:TRINITY_DN16220_c0_g3_i1.p1 TRINITY_DN16220_c0_g3~~TRINITY_DN16220_c0_g3_i1.p1  ORF type:complete len:946 (+),score=312.80 TRINITY_DN16220_c0_g3_i1:51-2888(+)